MTVRYSYCYNDTAKRVAHARLRTQLRKVARALGVGQARPCQCALCQHAGKAVGPYSGLTRAELRQTGTCEPDWY